MNHTQHADIHIRQGTHLSCPRLEEMGYHRAPAWDDRGAGNAWMVREFKLKTPRNTFNITASV